VDETLRPPPPSLCREGLPAALAAWALENARSLTAGAAAGYVRSAAAAADKSKAPEEVCSVEVESWRAGESSNAPPVHSDERDEPRTSSNASPVDELACIPARQPRCGAETDKIDEMLIKSGTSGGVGGAGPKAPSMRRVLIEMEVDRRRALGKQLTFLMSEAALH
jgi:hypothetical protein